MGVTEYTKENEIGTGRRGRFIPDTEQYNSWLRCFHPGDFREVEESKPESFGIFKSIWEFLFTEGTSNNISYLGR